MPRKNGRVRAWRVTAGDPRYPMILPVVVLALLLAGPGPAAGQLTLYQQLPDHNFGQASDTLFRSDSGPITASQVADDFASPAGGSVCGVNWWGFYGGTFGLDPGPPTAFVRNAVFVEVFAGA
ncbi:MAG: hypothetical protein U1A27_01725 [Phycisphaerae bacterium]